MTKEHEAFYHTPAFRHETGQETIGEIDLDQEEVSMRYSEAKEGRTFIMRLEHGEIVHEQIEAFAREHSIDAAKVMVVGGAASGSTLIAGTETDQRVPLAPLRHVLDGVHDIVGTGTIFRDEDGNPILHMHASCGRGNASVTGCIREGVRVWLVMEAVITEMVQCSAVREMDEATGIKLLRP